MPFPYISLNRFKFFNDTVASEVQDFDYVFFMNINTRCSVNITLFDIDLNKDYTFVLHDSYADIEFEKKPFEYNYESTAYIDNIQCDADYIGGRFFGAKPKNFTSMSNQLAKNITTDSENDIIAIWYDESHLNYFFNTNKMNILFNLLPIEYHFLEKNKDKNFYEDSKIWYVDKNKKKYNSLFSEIQKIKQVKEIANDFDGTNKTITFLIPPHDQKKARSGGFRTILKMINYMQENSYKINIEICGDFQTTIKEQKNKICAYNEIKNIEEIIFSFENKVTLANVYVVTGWQSFNKANFYISKNENVVFLCQDIEYEFSDVKSCETRLQKCKDFYMKDIPTFSIGNYIKNKLQSYRKIYSVNLNVNTTIYNKNGYCEKNGICLLYDSSKDHRLPNLILKIAIETSKKYLNKNIYLYGDDTMMDLDIKNDNIKLLGTLTAEETADLYKKCELGVIFSTTNPSRIAFEMVACGTPAIEADCEYTKYDMNNDAFVRMNTEFDDIMNKINELFNDPSEMKRLVNECENYSQTHFYANAEEKHFHNFVENELHKKIKCKNKTGVSI